MSHSADLGDVWRVDSRESIGQIGTADSDDIPAGPDQAGAAVLRQIRLEAVPMPPEETTT